MKEERLRIKPIGAHPRDSALESYLFENEDKTLKPLPLIKQEASNILMKHCLYQKDLMPNLRHLCKRFYAQNEQYHGRFPQGIEIHFRRKTASFTYIDYLYPTFTLFKNKARLRWVNVKTRYKTPNFEYVRYFNDEEEVDVLDEVFDAWTEAEVCLPVDD